jgi:hypothetical protein
MPRNESSRLEPMNREDGAPVSKPAFRVVCYQKPAWKPALRQTGSWGGVGWPPSDACHRVSDFSHAQEDTRTRRTCTREGRGRYSPQADQADVGGEISIAAMPKKEEEPDCTGCLGFLLPLIIVVFLALPPLLTGRRAGRFGAPPLTGKAAIASGVGMLGLALAVHVWNTRFYRRYPILRWLLVLLGSLTLIVSLFMR